MPKERSLKAALDRHTGRDYKQEKQHKQQKEASKRKRQRVEKKIEDDAVEDVGGVALDAAQAEATQLWKELNEAAAGSESDTDAQDEDTFDLSRIVDSDSDSDDESDDEVIDTDAAGLNDSLDASTPAILNGTTNGTKEQLEDGNEDGDEGPDSDDDSIALSDISAGPDAEDLIPHQRLTINNTTALTKALKSISLPYATLAFSDHQSITSPTPTTIADSNDDVERETAFYAQSLSAVQAARKQLKKEGVAFTRPTDYFAEMVKTDEHMSKIKAKLMDDAASKKASSEARKQRDLKKFGKQVQNEKLQERAKEKRSLLDKVKVLKRKRAQGDGGEADREGDLFDVALDDAAEGDKRERREGGGRRGRDRDGTMGPKRIKKNEKFGFGGSKRNAKRSDAVSTGDMSSYSTKRMKGQSSGSGRGGGSARGGKQRLGKSRRASNK